MIVGLARFVKRIFDVLTLVKVNPLALVLGPSNTNAAYLDIFSCKWYDVEKMVEFSKNF